MAAPAFVICDKLPIETSSTWLIQTATKKGFVNIFNQIIFSSKKLKNNVQQKYVFPSHWNTQGRHKKR